MHHFTRKQPSLLTCWRLIVPGTIVGSNLQATERFEQKATKRTKSKAEFLCDETEPFANLADYSVRRIVS